MIKASEIRKKVERHKEMIEVKLRAEEQQKKQDKINEELLEVEKAMNEFNNFISRKDPDLRIANLKYIRVPIMVSKDVEEILKNEGYYVLKEYNRIANNETKLYFNEKDYKRDVCNTATAIPCKNTLTTLDNDKSNLKTELHNKVEDECMVTKDDKKNEPKTMEDLYDEYMKELGESIDEMLEGCKVYKFQI